MKHPKNITFNIDLLHRYARHLSPRVRLLEPLQLVVCSDLSARRYFLERECLPALE